MFQALFQRLSKPHFHRCLKNISTIMIPTLGKRKLNHKELKWLLKAIQIWGEGRRFDQVLDSKATILCDHHLLSARACIRQGIQGSQTDITHPNSLTSIASFFLKLPNSSCFWAFLTLWDTSREFWAVASIYWNPHPKRWGGGLDSGSTNGEAGTKQNQILRIQSRKGA